MVKVRRAVDHLSELVDSFHHQLPGRLARHERIFAQYANRCQVDLVVFAGEPPGSVPNAVVLYDPGHGLLQVHLRKLEAAGLVSATTEVSEDGKAMKFYEVVPFALHLAPETIRTAARTLGTENNLEAVLR